MLAYAPTRNRPTTSKTTLSLIIAGHVAVVGLALAAKFEVERQKAPPPIDIYDVKTIKPKPPEPTKETTTKLSNPISTLDTSKTIVTIPTSFPVDPPLDKIPPGPIAGTDIKPPFVPQTDPPPVLRTKAQLRTAAADLRPPYPDGKRLTEEEATLRLKLAIDDKGRVIAVQPVGDVDRTFLEAARRHILRYWRYTPATEGGKAVHSSTTVTLTFELDG